MVRKHWRDPRFWRWFWHDRVAPEVKALVAAILIVLMLGGGWLAANRLSTANAGVSTPAAVLTFETTVQKLVTVHEKGKIVRKLVPVVHKVFVKRATAFQTTTDVQTHVVTISGGVRTVRSKVVVHVPVVSKKVITVDGKTKTVVTTRLVPTTRTQTQTLTNTLTRVQTLTQTQVQVQVQQQTQTQTQTQTKTQTQTQTQTNTVTTTRTVTQPVTTTRTVTTTQTQTETQTLPVTVTQTVTQTQTDTVTVTTP
jgi:hypothetical protein